MLRKAINLSLAVFFSSLFLILSFPPYKIVPAAYIAFVPLLVFSYKQSRVSICLAWWFTGVCFFSSIISWLTAVTVIGYILLSFYLSLYFLAFAGTLSFFQMMKGPFRAVAAGFIWVIFEWVRTYLYAGFGWVLLGYSQAPFLAFIQSAQWLKVWGVSCIVFYINLFIAQAVIFLCMRLIRRAGLYAGIAAALFLGNTGCGLLQIHRIDGRAYERTSVILVQGNIAQIEKWNPEADCMIIERYKTLTDIADIRGALVVWPETAIPFFLNSEDDAIEKHIVQWIRSGQFYLLSGIVCQQGNSFYNSAVLFSPEGVVLQQYKKIRIVPFGEYTPYLFKRFLPIIPELTVLEDFGRGGQMSPFLIERGDKTVSFGVLICFENLYPDLAQVWNRKKVDSLFVLSNDAWFGVSAAAEQHLQASIFRAVENRVSVFQCTNTGITAAIDPAGRVSSLSGGSDGTGLFAEGVLSTQLTYLP